MIPRPFFNKYFSCGSEFILILRLFNAQQTTFSFLDVVAKKKPHARSFVEYYIIHYIFFFFFLLIDGNYAHFLKIK